MNMGAAVDMNAVTRNTEREANERNARNERNAVVRNCRTGSVQTVRAVVALLDDSALLERSRMAEVYSSRVARSLASRSSLAPPKASGARRKQYDGESGLDAL